MADNIPPLQVNYRIKGYRYCLDHPKDEVQFVCKDCQEKLVCSSCISTTHFGHKVIAINLIVQEKFNNLQDLSTEARDVKIPRIKSRIKEANKTGKAIQICISDHIENVEEQGEFLKRLIETSTSQTVSALKGIYRKITTELNTFVSDSENVITKLEEMAKEVKETTKSDDNVLIVDVEQELIASDLQEPKFEYHSVEVKFVPGKEPGRQINMALGCIYLDNKPIDIGEHKLTKRPSNNKRNMNGQTLQIKQEKDDASGSVTLNTHMSVDRTHTSNVQQDRQAPTIKEEKDDNSDRSSLSAHMSVDRNQACNFSQEGMDIDLSLSMNVDHFANNTTDTNTSNSLLQPVKDEYTGLLTKPLISELTDLNVRPRSITRLSHAGPMLVCQADSRDLFQVDTIGFIHPIRLDTSVCDVSTHPLTGHLFCASTEDNSVRSLDLQNGKTCALFRIKEKPWSVAVTHGGNVLVGTYRPLTVTSYTTTGAVVDTITCSDNARHISVCKSTGRVAVSCDSAGVMVTDANLHHMFTFKLPGDVNTKVWDAVFDAKGNLIVADIDKKIHIADSTTGKIMRTITLQDLGCPNCLYA